jgi:hypothetical protein
MDDIKTEGALTKQSISHMTDSIKNIQEGMDKGFEKIFTKFDELP